ncbi:MAG: ADP-ribosylation factor-like protein, partial [Candidatus Odinarchaeota archaeon]
DKPDRIILIGLAESGKTTIIKVIGEGYVPDKEASYQATLDYKRKHISLLGERLTIFDLGGQKTFLDRFTGEMAKFIFTKVRAMIFVIDCIDVSRLSLAKYYLELTANNLKRYSPTAPLFVLLHKMDLVDKEKVEELSSNMKIFLEAGLQQPLIYFETTVFDETIFNAFGTIITSTTRVHEPLERIIDKFSDENASIVNIIQLFSESGVPLIDTSKSPHVFFEGTKTNLDEILVNLTNRKGLARSAFIELENEISVVRFLNNGAVLFLNFSRANMQKKGESIPSVYNKVILLTDKLNSLDSQS